MQWLYLEPVNFPFCSYDTPVLQQGLDAVPRACEPLFEKKKKAKQQGVDPCLQMGVLRGREKESQICSALCRPSDVFLFV